MFGFHRLWMTLAVVALLGARSVWAQNPTAAISAPAAASVSTSSAAVAVTFSGSVSSSSTILYAAYGVFDDTNATVAESLITGGTTFSVTPTLTATTAGKAYTLVVGVLDLNGYAVTSKTVTVTLAGCDPNDFVCQVALLWSDATTTVDAMTAAAYATINALISAGDFAGATQAAKDYDKAAKDFVKDTDKTAKDLEKDAKNVSKALEIAVKAIRKIEEDRLDQTRKDEKDLMDLLIDFSQIAPTDYPALAQSALDYGDFYVKDDTLDIAKDNYKYVLDQAQADIDVLFEGTVTQAVIDQAIAIMNQAEIDARALQAAAEVAAPIAQATAEANAQVFLALADPADQPGIQNDIDNFNSNAAQDIASFTSKADQDIPKDIDKMQQDIDKEIAKL